MASLTFFFVRGARLVSTRTDSVERRELSPEDGEHGNQHSELSS